MPARVPVGLCLAAVLAFAAVDAAAQGPVAAAGLLLEADPVGCLVAGRQPLIGACVRPAGGRARLYFRARGQHHWYYVVMRPGSGASGCLEGVLPAPKRGTLAVEYYVEALSSELLSARTQEFSADVVGAPPECSGRRIATIAVGVGRVLVSGPTGASALPPGFLASGVASVVPPAGGQATAAAGAGTASGVSGTTVALIVGGGAALAGAVVAVSAGGGGPAAGSTTIGANPAAATIPTTSTTTTTTLARPAVSLSFVSGNPPPGSSVQDPGGTATLNLTVSIAVASSAELPNGRVFVSLTRRGTACANTWAPVALVAGASRTFSLEGFVVAGECRPAPFDTDSAWLRLYDMNTPTTPIGEAASAVAYRIVP